jgi:hypothetical protein
MRKQDQFAIDLKSQQIGIRYFTGHREGRLEVGPYPVILPRLSLGCDPLRKGAGEGGGRRPERSTKSPLIAATLLFSRRASTICIVV